MPKFLAKSRVQITNRATVLYPLLQRPEGEESTQNAQHEDKETTTDVPMDNNEVKSKRFRHGQKRPDDLMSLNVENFLKNPDYMEYRESSKFKKQEKLGKFEDCFYECDCGILPMDLEWFFQAHPILTIIISYMFVLMTIIVVFAIVFMSRRVANEQSKTFAWKALTSTYLMTLTYHNQKMPSQLQSKKISFSKSLQVSSETLTNCTLFGATYQQLRVETSSIHYICLASIILAQCSSLLFLTWKKFRAYTFQIAVLALKVQTCFLFIDLIHVSCEFIRVKLSFRQEMVAELTRLKTTGISYWWTMTQETSKCCGITAPREYNNKFPSSCCDPLKSVSKCRGEPLMNEIYDRGCYLTEKNTLDLYGILFMVSIILIIIFSIVLIYVLEGVEVGSRSIWKKPNSSFDSQNMSIETFGTVGIVSLDSTKHYSKLTIKADNFNQYSDGIFDYKFDTEYQIQFQRNDITTGRAVIESPNTTDQKLKMDLEFDETEGVVAMIY